MMAEVTNESMMEVLRIQETQAEHSRQFDDQSARLQRVEKRLDGIYETMFTTLGIAGHANIRHDAVTEKLDDLTRRVEKLENS